GDVVECDDIRGKVSSIGYRTTFIETLDGSIIAFQNNQLFNKNFRNLTKNHLYEYIKVEIGISYGTDIDLARELILTALKEVVNLARAKDTTVVLDSFGDNAVNLGVWVWVPVRNKPASLSKVREKIYQTFNEHGITIPFPQQDIYIKSMPANNNVTLP
ncbi:MAG: mechanosensitive ion channel, partial [Akkermansia sp.]